MLERTIAPPMADPHPPTRVTLPPGACDAHCHVFGPARRFPFAPERTYTPPDSVFEDLVRLHEGLGFSRGVLVQASCHGTDNSAMVDTLNRGGGRFAGVAMISELTDQAELAAMHQAGVRGIRFNFVSHLGASPEPSRVWAMIDKIAPLGWHIDLHFDAVELADHDSWLSRMPIPFIIDHMARVDAGSGLAQPAFTYLLKLLETNGSAWVKISGAERVTRDPGPPYEDVVPFARALIEVAADRVLWGTDWPHPNVRHMPDDGDLVDLLADFAPDHETRNRILVDNPQRLYDFAD